MNLEEKINELELQIATNSSQILALESRNKEIKKQKAVLLKMVEKLKEVLK